MMRYPGAVLLGPSPNTVTRISLYLITQRQQDRGTPLSDKILQTSDATFSSDVLESELPVLLDFWAEWCGPCKAIAPLLDSIADEYEGRLKIVKINIDENPGTPPKYGIRSIPTLMVFKGGEVQAQKLGLVSKAALTEFLDSSL